MTREEAIAEWVDTLRTQLGLVRVDSELWSAPYDDFAQTFAECCVKTALDMNPQNVTAQVLMGSLLFIRARLEGAEGAA